MTVPEYLQVLFVPGYGNSTGAHWQCEWFSGMPDAIWVEQSQWEAPDLDAWLAGLDSAANRAVRPILFVTHSLGGLLVAAWAERCSVPVAGAFLVVPPDATSPAFPNSIKGFANPSSRLKFPSMLVATRNDRYASFDASRAMAATLGSTFVDAGDKHHINPAAGFGPWPQGEHLLANFCSELTSHRKNGACL
jgi:hypothetical protein